MASRQVGRWGGILLLGLRLVSGTAQAGGPVLYNESDGQPVHWLNNRAVYVVETGKLGAVDNERAAGIVEQAFQTWAQVSTADLRVENLAGLLSPEELTPFRKDINAEDFSVVECTLPGLESFQAFRIDCEAFAICVAQIDQVAQGASPDQVKCPSPIIFDENGTITEQFFGVSNTVVGFSGPNFFSIPGDPVEPFRILQASMVLNGAFFDQDIPGEDPDGTLFLEALMTHEFGHFLGLGHSVANGETAQLNPLAEQVGAGTPESQTAAEPIDGLAAVGVDDTETMYPVLLTRGDTGESPLKTLEQDDRTALSELYPCTEEGQCTQPLSTTGTITGSVYIPCTEEEVGRGLCLPAASNQKPVKRAQGIAVVARKLAPNTPDTDLDGDGRTDFRVLREAVSQLTGNTFAPLRCNGPVHLDGDADGNPDNDGDGSIDANNPLDVTGVFGPCSSPDEAGFLECATQINANFRGGGRFFLGQCGFTSLGFSDPQAVGQTDNDAENSYRLTALSPGTYIVQAFPVIAQAGYSSPVRTSFFGPSPNVQSDDNVNLALFPNPQVGEFYNGPQGGCREDSPTVCLDTQGNPSEEMANSSDNPFAYTLITVEAGQIVDDINIFLNTTTAVIDNNTDPGFDFCELGDVDNNGILDQKDLGAAIQEKARFDAGVPLNQLSQRADLNQDGRITFRDFDILTDILSIPDPFSGDLRVRLRNSERVRGLASFEAICRTAANPQNSCQFQAPVETIRDNGTPTLSLCVNAETFGCRDLVFGQDLDLGCDSVEPVGCTAISAPTSGMPIIIEGSLADTDQESLFEPSNFADCYTFSLTDPQPIAIRLESSDFDTELALIRPSNNAFVQNDDCPDDGLNSCLPSDALQGGNLNLASDTYTVEVTSPAFAGAVTGAYRLTISADPFGLGPVSSP